MLLPLSLSPGALPQSQSSCLETWFPSYLSHSTLGLSETLFILSTFLLTTTEEALGSLLTEGSKNNRKVTKIPECHRVLVGIPGL